VVKDLANPFNTAATAVDLVWKAVEKLISWLGKIKVPKALSDAAGLLPGRAAPAGAGGTSGGTRSVGGIPVSSGGGITINISGAVDPYATAQQIRRILSRGAVISGRQTP
jgi:hypothetical protein